MKILLIHLEGDEQAAGRILPIIDELNISVEAIAAGSLKDISTAMDAKMDIVMDAGPEAAMVLSSLPVLWFGFLAGFSRNSGMPILVYGEKAINGIPLEVSSYFVTHTTDKALKSFLEKTNETFKQEEAKTAIIRAREALLDMGVPVNEESMAVCAAEGNIEWLALFLAAGFSPDTTNNAGVPMINICARKGKAEAARLLLQAGARLDLKAKDRESTALIDSIQGNHDDLAKELIKAGADINIRNRDGQSALILAVANGNEAMSELLLRAGADPDVPDSLGQSARQYAILFSRESITALIDSIAPR